MNAIDRARLHADRLSALVVGVLGFLVLFLGYRGTSGTGLIAQQLSYIVSGGIVGLSLVGVSAVMWLSADLRDQWRELYELRLILDRGHDEGETASGPSQSAWPPDEDMELGIPSAPPVVATPRQRSTVTKSGVKQAGAGRAPRAALARGAATGRSARRAAETT